MALFHYNCPPISSEDLGVFFSYVYAGYFVSNDKSIEIYYNEDVDQWEKVKDCGCYGETNAEEGVLHWINEFKKNYDITDFDIIPYILVGQPSCSRPE